MRKPTIFGKYLLLERVNVGGMAEVFIAKAFGVEGFERILAIKKILPTMAEDEEFITMFIDEARISVQLNHANIVHIHELGKHDDAYFIAMEYVSGRDLRTMLERYRRRKEIMPTAQAVFVASKICEGLDYAHRKKDARGQELLIIHRDVSPQNILCSYEGEVKIIDFGIAKAANRSQKTQAGILKGKFGYMSPEQVRGLPIDRRSDVFAVGVILYEMLTGEKLFVGESDFSTLEKVRNAEVASPRQFNPNIPPGLEKVVMKALTREAEDRYQWASDLQEDLMRFLLAGDAIYSAKHLANFMKEAFAEDLLRESEKMERFANIDRPDQIESSGITAAHDKNKKSKPATSTAAQIPALTSNPTTSAIRPSRAMQAATTGNQAAASGNSAVATGLQNATVNIPPPTAEELAEMDGPGDRTQIVDPDSKTMIGTLPVLDSNEPSGSTKATEAVRGNVPSVDLGRDEAPTGSLDKTMAPTAAQPGRRMRSSTNNGRMPQVDGQNGRASGEKRSLMSEKSDLSTGNDLRPLDQTGFIPAMEQRGEDEEDPTRADGPPTDATMPPRPVSVKPKIVIGDGVQYSGATMVGPSPLAKPADDEDTGSKPVPATRQFQENEEEEDRDAEAEGEEGYEDEEGAAEGEEGDAGAEEELEEDPTGAGEDELATTAARPEVKKKAASAGMSPQQKKVAIIGGSVTVLLIAVLAVVAVMMLGSNPGQLVVLIKGPDGAPGGPFSVKVNPGNKTFDGEKAISLDPGDYSIEVIPGSKSLESKNDKVSIRPGEVRKVVVSLRATGGPGPTPSKPAPGETADAPPKPGEPKPTEPKPNEAKPTEPSPAGKPGEAVAVKPGETKPAEPKPEEVKPTEGKANVPVPSSYTVAFITDEPGVEVLLDGRRVGKTPDLKVPGLAFDRVHKAQASKAGFQTINLVIDNKDKLDVYEQKLTMVKEEGPAPKETKPVAEKPAPKKEETAPPKETKPVAEKPAPKKEEAPPPKKEEAPPPKKAEEAPKKEEAPAKKGGKAKGKFACATKPLGAEVWVDGKNTGEKTPISLSKAIDLPVGKHKVLFKLNGKQSGPHEINVEEDQVAKLTGITFD
ncbi:MAG: protein kinase [Myxococcaceae bacterium]|nr:protein kinase [Myxococcaceae bacterium]